MRTRDRFWLETPTRIRTLIADGCARVEMEAYAIGAVAKLRGVPLAHVVCGGDDLAGEASDNRSWTQWRVVLAACARGYDGIAHA